MVPTRLQSPWPSFSQLRRLSHTNTGSKLRANASGDTFSQALLLANEGKHDEALGALQQLEKDGYGAYPLSPACARPRY